MKWFRKKLIALAVCWLLFGNIAVKARESTPTTDFVLVIDCTGSLSDSDPLKWGVAAAKSFVETLPTENVRVSVIGFGAEWDRNETYTMKNGGRTFQLVTEAFPLSESGGVTQNAQIRGALERIGDEYGNYTQIGYALSAAVDVLERGNTAQDSACIILVSDGRITGQSDQTVSEGNYERYKSIENAIGIAASKEWPIYCLELNYDRLNGGSNWPGAQAREQLDHISESTGGERIEVIGTDTVLRKFTEIIERYFELESDIETIEIQGKKATKEFPVAEMTAETNIIISGKELGLISRIAITDPDGNTKEYREDSYTDSRRITFDLPHYIRGKLIKPRAGKWTVTVYGDDGVIIEIQIIPLREVELKLNTLHDLSGGVKRDTLVEFTAHFVYNDQSYSSDAFYRDSKAYLEIVETGKKFPLEGGMDNYKGTISFDKVGTYTVRAVVEDGIFRNDKKISGSYSIDVKADPILPSSSSIPDQTMAVGSRLMLDCSGYFSGGDGGQITYGVSFDKTIPFKCDIAQNGILTIEAGEKAETVQIVVSKKDRELEESALQQFLLTITNEKPQILKEGQIYIDLTAGGNSVLEKLASVFRVNLQNEATLDLSTYFADPENLPLCYQWEYGTEMGDARPFTVEENEGNCILRAEESGAGIAYLQAIDSGGETSDKITVSVNIVGSGNLFFRQTWVFWVVLAFVVLAALIFGTAVFGNRKLYGIWTVTVNYGAPINIRFSQYKQGKKAKCKLSELINMIQPCNFQSGDVMICAGNGITKKVMIKGLDKCPQLSVMINGQPLQTAQTMVCDKVSQNLIELTDKNHITVRLQRIG